MDRAALNNLQRAVEIAQNCLGGCLTPLQASCKILAFVDAWHPAWQALNGAQGPLSALYVAEEEAHRLHFLGADVERWHPDVRERKRAELAEAEARMAPAVEAACRVLIAYASQTMSNDKN